MSKCAEKGSERRAAILLWAIIIGALAIRLWGVSHHLPYKVDIEEDEFIYTAMKYGTGDLNPHWFFHPPLYTYILFSLYAVFYLAGALLGSFHGPEDFIILYLSEPSGFYLIARVLNAFLAVPSILVLYHLGRRFYSSGCALAACVLFAVMPLDVIYSHVGCTEPLLILFTLLAALFAARVLEGADGLKYYLLSGACAGLATGTKYIGLFAFIPLLVACVASGKGRRLGACAAGLAAGAAAFLAVCPFPIISFSEYLANVNMLRFQTVTTGEIPWDRLTNLHLLFFIYYMPQGMGYVLTALSAAGIVFLWIRHRRSDVFIAFLPTVFFAAIGFSHMYYDRYMLICYPFLALAAAALLEAVAGRFGGRRSRILASLCIIVALPTVLRSVRDVSRFALPDTRFLASDWIISNIPAGSRILVDIVPIPRNASSLDREQKNKMENPRSGFGYRDKSETYFQLQRRVAERRKGFDVTRILHPRGFRMRDRGREYDEEWMTPEKMKRTLEELDRYDYVLVSGHKAWRYGNRDALPESFFFMNDFYATIGKKGVLVKKFSAKEGESQGHTFMLYRVGKGAGDN